MATKTATKSRSMRLRLCRSDLAVIRRMARAYLSKTRTMADEMAALKVWRIANEKLTTNQSDMKEREIKFRAWLPLGGFMMPDFDNWVDFKGNYWTTSEKKHDTPNIEISCYKDQSVIILMQFTGLKDKNGKEIYEGDICRRNGHIRVIIFHHGSFLSVPTKHWMDEVDNDNITALHKGWHLINFIADIEVIGNIHENPDLTGLLTAPAPASPPAPPR